MAVDHSESEVAVRIGRPAKCRYRGGNRSLGTGGRQFWIKSGRLGHGQFRLSHAIPIETVKTVVISERDVEGREISAIRGRRYPSAVGRVFTDISVHTTDGQTAFWVVEGRDADWVRRRLSPVLEEWQIPLE